ncbi:MAG: RNA polymerase sigma factor RpoD/SigA [Treponema sp.]|nr:RNA polymerase sigma factor RpoD/SigA [Treponema sp.]
MTNDDSVLSMYLKEINKVPLLSHEEQSALALEAQKGNKQARDKIVNANLRFVVNVAKNYQNHGLDLVDLISEGNIGLLTAVDKFQPEKGYHFISYAVWWIRQSILKAVCEKSRSIRLPLNKANELVRIEQAKKVVAGKKSEQQEYEEIAEMLNMNTAHVREMLNISREMISLDAELNGSEDSKTSFGEMQEDKNYVRPEDAAITESMNQEIDEVLKTLRPNEEKVIRMRYGLNGTKPMSLKEVGDECNLTKERIRQIEKHAIVRLQHPTRSKYLEAFVA